MKNSNFICTQFKYKEMEKTEIAKRISSHEREMVAEIVGVSKNTVDKVIAGKRKNEYVLTACENIIRMREDMKIQLTSLMNSMASQNILIPENK